MTTDLPPSVLERARLGGHLVRGLLVVLLGVVLWTIAYNFELLRPLSTGQPAPTLGLQTFSGQPISLEALRGRVVLVQFWASWCPPCRAEMPVLKRIRARYGDGLVILGVAVKEPEEDSRALARELALPWPTGSGDAAGIAERWGVDSLPRAMLVDRKGMLRKQWIGPASEGQLSAAIDALLGE